MSTKHNPTAKKSDKKKPATKSAKPAAVSKPATKGATKPAAKAKVPAPDEAPAVEDAPVANDSLHDAPTEEPAAIGAAEPVDAATANTDAGDAAPEPEVGTRDAIDVLIWRARATTPEALGHFLEATPGKDLRDMQERLVGNRVRYSKSETIAQIAAALSPVPAASEAKPDDSSASPPAAESDASESAAKAPRESVARDLPPVGTVIVKRDRTGAERARCTVVEGGVEYSGKIHKSLSGAAIAAAHDLGLTTKQLNGWAWWGIAPRPAKARAPKGLDLDGIAKLWTRYRERVEAALKGASPDEKAQLHVALNAHSTALLHLAGESVAE